MWVHMDGSEVELLAEDLFSVPAKVDAKSTQVVSSTAKAVEEAAKRFAPVLTGRLRDSIEAHSAGLHAEISSNTPYADYVEYGTSDTPTQPYMRPAAEVAYQKLADGLGDAGEDIL